jgi:hypothetical protein
VKDLNELRARLAQTPAGNVAPPRQSEPGHSENRPKPSVRPVQER